MNKNIILVLVVIITVFTVFFMINRGPQEEISQPQATPTPESTATAVPRTGTSKPVVENAELYGDLVVQYEGKRIQFDIGCQAIPNNVTYKNGTTIMLDNRSGDARWISIGGTGYQVSGYGYRIITLTSKTFPADLMISCGSAVNVGRILLQQ